MAFPRAMQLTDDVRCLVVSDPLLAAYGAWDFEAELIRFDGEIASWSDMQTIVGKLQAEQMRTWNTTFTVNSSTFVASSPITVTWSYSYGGAPWIGTSATVTTGSFASPFTLTTTGTSGWSTSYATCSLSLPQISSNYPIKLV